MKELGFTLVGILAVVVVIVLVVYVGIELLGPYLR